MPEETATPAKRKNVYLTDRQKREMFERWDTGRYTQLELATWYGCGETQIWSLIQRREELGPLREDDPELTDALDIKNIEDVLETIMAKIGRIASKPSMTEGDRLVLSTLRGTAKTVLDIRKQLKELPKDLHDRTAPPIDRETTREMIALIPPERQEKFLQLMRGLAQAQGQPSPDLGRKSHTERKKPKEEPVAQPKIAHEDTEEVPGHA